MRTPKECRKEWVEQNGYTAEVMSALAVIIDSIAACPSIARQLQEDGKKIVDEARIAGTLYGPWDGIDEAIEKEKNEATNKLIDMIEKHKNNLTLDQIALLLINEPDIASQRAGHTLEWALGCQAWSRRHPRKK
jgi:hypothetical protein